MVRLNVVGEKRDNVYFIWLGIFTMIRGIAIVLNIVVINDVKRFAFLVFLKNGVNMKDIMMMVILYK